MPLGGSGYMGYTVYGHMAKSDCSPSTVGILSTIVTYYHEARDGGADITAGCQFLKLLLGQDTLHMQHMLAAGLRNGRPRCRCRASWWQPVRCSAHGGSLETSRISAHCRVSRWRNRVSRCQNEPQDAGQ